MVRQPAGGDIVSSRPDDVPVGCGSMMLLFLAPRHRRDVEPVVLAAQTRDDRIETVHRGHAVLVGPDGAVSRVWGAPEAAMYWRSAAKPLQAAAVTGTGAWDAFGLGARELAVACGSHAGEADHREAVEQILAAADIPAGALACATHRPWSRHSVRPPGGPDAIGNNCSGKHAAMLAACRHMGWPLEGYLGRSHPVQEAVAEVVARATGRAPDGLAWAVDGCGIPTWRLPLVDLARSWQWLAGKDPGRRVLAAVAGHPLMVSGTDQFCTDLAAATGGEVLGKYGALGVYGALHRPSGAALAVKVEDGGERPCKAVAGAIMAQAGWLGEGAAAALHDHLHVPNRNHAGVHVGVLEARLEDG